MINYTARLNKALRIAAWAHEKQGQHRKGTDTPYIIHPIGVMMIASNVTDDENILIACLFHDILEDVDSSIYSEVQMVEDFGSSVVSIVRDVTKDRDEKDWRKRSEAYLYHLEYEASNEAIIVSASDKIHNLFSINEDYREVGEALWQRFTTKNKDDQIWWYESILDVIKRRHAPEGLVQQLNEYLEDLKNPKKRLSGWAIAVMSFNEKQQRNND